MRPRTGATPHSVSLWALLLLTEAVTVTAELDINSSSASLFWSTAKEEEDLLRNTEPNGDSLATSVVSDHDQLDGGFSSLDRMLQWAIGHSDPAKLKETAQDVHLQSSRSVYAPFVWPKMSMRSVAQSPE